MNRRRFFTKKKVIAVLVITTIILGCIAGYFIYLDKPNEAPGQTTNPVNYDPPTDDEEADSQARKQEVQKQQEQSDSTSKKKVTPIVANASQNGQEVFISGYVPGVVEDEETCTYTITKDDKTVTKKSAGFVNVSNTNCTPVTINRSEFGATGDWQVVLSYSSSSASGVSQPMTLKVQ